MIAPADWLTSGSACLEQGSDARGQPKLKPSRRAELLNFSRISSLARGPSVQTLATSVASQTLTVASGVIAARALGVEGRGTLAILWLLPLILALLGGIGIPQATTFYVARELDNARAVVSIAVRISLLQALLLSSAYAIGLLLFSGGSQVFSPLDGLLSVALVPMFLIQNLGVAALLGMKRYRAFNAGRIIPAFMYALGVFALFVFHHATLTSILAVSLGSWATGAMITWLLVRHDLSTNGESAQVTTREVLKFGLRGVIGSVSPIDDVRVDQLMVGALMDTRALGLYVAALAFCNLPRFIAQSIGSVSFPRIASAANASIAWQLTRRSFRIGVVAIGGCVAALFVLMPTLLPLLFGDDFSEAVGLGRILLVAAFFLSVHRLLTELARGLGHPGYGSITEVVSLAFFLIGILIFATPASTYAVATAVLMGGLASSTLLAIMLRRLGKFQAGVD